MPAPIAAIAAMAGSAAIGGIKNAVERDRARERERNLRRMGERGRSELVASTQGAQRAMDQYRGMYGEAGQDQMYAMDQYRRAIEGQGPSVAEAQLQRGADQAAAQQIALAGTARGSNLGAAQRAATSAGVGAQMDANAQAAQLRAQEQQAALQGYSAMANQRAQQLAQQEMGYAQLWNQGAGNLYGTDARFALGMGDVMLRGRPEPVNIMGGMGQGMQLGGMMGGGGGGGS